MTAFAVDRKQVWGYVQRAPGTFIWLAILLATTIILDVLPPSAAERVLGNRSTNLHHLAEDPVRVLVSSAFWIDTGGWYFYLFIFVFYLLVYNLIHVPVERWLGTARWLVVVVIAHVGATYVSEGVLYWAINSGRLPDSERYTLDYGVSYALMGVAGVLVYRIARPWQYYYLATLALIVVLPLLAKTSFTAVGHCTALLIGLACYPLIRWPRDLRGGAWDPSAAWRSWRASASSRSGPQ